MHRKLFFIWTILALNSCGSAPRREFTQIGNCMPGYLGEKWPCTDFNGREYQFDLSGPLGATDFVCIRKEEWAIHEEECRQ